MLNINRLLKKKSWTGAELGRLELANTAISYHKAVTSGNPYQEPPVSKADLRKMLNTIDDPEEGRIYNGYLAIHTWISNTSQIAVSQHQQAQLNYNQLVHAVSTAYTSEDVYHYVEQLPLIMTEKQYKDTVKKRTKELLHESGKEDILQLLFSAISYNMTQLEKHPRAKNPLKPLKKTLEKEQVQDVHILDNYNIIWGEGYYTLEDGTRSDKVSPEEWQKLVSPKISSLLANNSNIDEETAKLLEESIIRRRCITDAKYMYEGNLTEREAQAKRHEEEIKQGFAKACQWHYYEDSPKGKLTKWDVLEEWNEYSDLFIAGKTDAENIVLCKAFAAEFPTVIEALLDDIQHKYPALATIKTTPIEKWLTTTYTVADLYTMDFYGYQERFNDDISIFEGNKRALFNGIAILKPSDRYSSCVDKNGYYQAPDLRGSIRSLSLEAYFPEYEEYGTKVDMLEESRKLLFQSLYFIEGFNKGLDIIAAIYKVEEVKLFKIELEPLLSKIEALNNLIYMLYQKIANTDYEDKELQAKKLEVLKDVLYPVNLKKIRIPKAKLQQAKQIMKDFKCFTDDNEDPYFTLCFYDPDAVEEDDEPEDEKGVTLKIWRKK